MFHWDVVGLRPSGLVKKSLVNARKMIPALQIVRLFVEPKGRYIHQYRTNNNTAGETFENPSTGHSTIACAKQMPKKAYLRFWGKDFTLKESSHRLKYTFLTVSHLFPNCYPFLVAKVEASTTAIWIQQGNSYHWSFSLICKAQYPVLSYLGRFLVRVSG